MALDSFQEQQLTGAGDTLLHYHLADRTPTHETLRTMQTVASTRSVSDATVVVTEQDDLLLVDSTAGDVTLNLPAARSGKELVFKKIAAANSMILDGEGTETIDGAATITINTQWATCRLKAYQGAWYIISGYL